MDRGLRLMVYMWREFNDDWYRIQTNAPQVINKLKRRSKTKNTIRICGKTTPSSTQQWIVFRVKYNKPSTAKRSFKRITNCQNNFTYRSGVYSAEIGRQEDILFKESNDE